MTGHEVALLAAGLCAVALACLRLWCRAQDRRDLTYWAARDEADRRYLDRAETRGPEAFRRALRDTWEHR